MLTRRAICGWSVVLAAGGAWAQTIPTVTLLAPEGPANARVANLVRQLAVAGIRVAVSPGGGPVQNVNSLLQRSNAEVAVLPANVLAFLHRAGLLPQAAGALRAIGRLYDAPVQILAGANVTDVAQLAAQRVGCGAANSVSFVAGTELLAALGLQVRALPMPPAEALQALRRRDIAAMVLVKDAPDSLLFNVNREQDGVHFLPLGVPGRLAAQYPPAQLTIQEYPLLIGEGEAGTGAPIPTVAVPMLLAAYNWPPGTAAHASISRLATAFSRIESSPAEIPDWTRFAPGAPSPVMAGTAPAQPAAPTIAQAPTRQAPDLNTQNREALFKEFEKWLRQQKP